MVNVRRFRSDLLKWFSRNGREYPWRTPDSSVYEVFVAEFFLTQTPAENVADVYPHFLAQYPSLNAIDTAPRDELEAAIRPLGFQRMRADALCVIAAEYEALPETPDALESLPRVGPYVANATLCFALGRRLPIVDRNVRRIYRRILGDEYPQPNSNAEEELLLELLPRDGETARAYNLALLDFGALVCQKRDPRCGECPLADACTFYANRSA